MNNGAGFSYMDYLEMNGKEVKWTFEEHDGELVKVLTTPSGTVGRFPTDCSMSPQEYWDKNNVVHEGDYAKGIGHLIVKVDPDTGIDYFTFALACKPVQRWVSGKKHPIMNQVVIFKVGQVSENLETLT